MSSEQRRIIATLVVALGFGLVIALLRRSRVARARAKLEASFPIGASAALGEDEVPFVTLKSLEEARTMHHTAVVLQGGTLGQIYLTVPVKHVACDQTTLVGLLRSIDALAYDDPARAVLSFELAPIGSGIAGGVGGASVIDGIWVHPNLDGTDAASLAERAIYGNAGDGNGRTPDRG
jgi:hypothetical protein